MAYGRAPITDPLIPGNREIIRASNVDTGLDSGGTATSEIQMNDAARVDLDRWYAMVSINNLTATGLYPTHSFADKLSLTTGSNLRGGAQPLIYGEGDVRASWDGDPRRMRARAYHWGVQDFASNDKMQLVASLDGTALECDFTTGVVSSSGYLSPAWMPDGPPRTLGGDKVSIDADDNADRLTIEASVSGWAWGDGLELTGTPAAVAATEECPNADGIGVCGLSSLLLPGNQQIVQGGTSAPLAPAAFFDSSRPWDLVRIGWVWLSAGNKILLEIQNRGVDVVAVSASIPFWPASGSPGRCR